MSALEVSRVCRDVLFNRDFRAAMLADPQAALAERPLGETERAALLAGDVAALFRGGANAFLLGYLARYGVCGLDWPTFNARMRALAEPPAPADRNA